MSFHISGRVDDDLRLKSATALVNDGKATITIIIETSDMLALGHAMKKLAEVRASQDMNVAQGHPSKSRPLAYQEQRHG
ncbi:MAG: hypothetical protein KBG46_08290 [Paracoccus sp.]|nr:hypothetical protein [Paracoccus sp. (in: a-proteobacteria)]